MAEVRGDQLIQEQSFREAGQTLMHVEGLKHGFMRTETLHKQAGNVSEALGLTEAIVLGQLSIPWIPVISSYLESEQVKFQIGHGSEKATIKVINNKSDHDRWMIFPYLLQVNGVVLDVDKDRERFVAELGRNPVLADSLSSITPEEVLASIERAIEEQSGATAEGERRREIEDREKRMGNAREILEKARASDREYPGFPKTNIEDYLK